MSEGEVSGSRCAGGSVFVRHHGRDDGLGLNVRMSASVSTGSDARLEKLWYRQSPGSLWPKARERLACGSIPPRLSRTPKAAVVVVLAVPPVWRWQGKERLW
jgi:hypothetical protein